MPDTDKTTARPKRRYNKWKPEFDAELLRDWHGTSLSEFARRFDSQSTTVRNHAVRLGLMVWPEGSADNA